MTIYEGHFTFKDEARIAIVASRFNEFIVSKLIGGAKDAILRHGAPEDAIDIFWAPGGFELPAVAGRIAHSGKYAGVAVVGCIIRGSTPHFDYIAAEVSKGIAMVSMEASCPVTFGVLTTDTIEQAIERAGTKAGNKGFDAAMSLLEMIDLYGKIKKL